MSNMMIVMGVAVGVAIMAGAIAYGTENQKNYVSDDAILASAAEQGLLPKTGVFSADLNKEQWHEDPFAERAAEIREKFENER